MNYFYPESKLATCFIESLLPLLNTNSDIILLAQRTVEKVSKGCIEVVTDVATKVT